jgi:hypothetical protein
MRSLDSRSRTMPTSPLYTVARAAAARYLEEYQRERADRPYRPGLTYDQLIDGVVLAAVQALQGLPKPRMSNSARAAFERLVAGMPDDRGDIRLVREEMIGRAPLHPDTLARALQAQLGNAVIADAVMRTIRQHNWGPIAKIKGRKNTAPVEYRYCPHHGANAEFRLYMSGQRGQQWRCWLCLQDAKARSRQRTS